MLRKFLKTDVFINLSTTQTRTKRINTCDVVEWLSMAEIIIGLHEIF